MHRYLLILLFLVPGLAYSQSGTLQGTVRSRNEALAGVNIAIQKIHRGAATDPRGKFIIKNIEPGTYQLVVSAVGFHEYRQKIVVESSGPNIITVELEKKTEKLGEVVVTGTMRETFVRESPVKVAVITPKRLRRGKMSSNIMDLIDNVNGLSTQLNCGVCGTNAIRINGVEGPNTAVLIDGMPIMGALASVYGLNGISPSIIDQVEVIKGPQSTLYGTQALGGVVNIITKNPKYTPTFSADMYAESTGEANIDLSTSPQLGRLNGFVSSNFLRMENYFDHNGDNFNDIAKRSRFSIFGKGTLEGSNGERRLNLTAKFYIENRTGGVKEFSDELRGSDRIYGESIYTRRAELMADYQPAGLDERLKISGAFTSHRQDSYYGTNRYDAEQGIIFGQTTWDQPVSERVQLLIGVTARYQTYNDNTPATSVGTNRRFIPGTFAQSELSLNSLTILGGLRVDHHKEHGFVTAPRLSVKYSPDERTTFRAAGGTGFRVVNVFTEDHAALTGSREIVFTENLDPERSKSITVSAEHIISFDANPLTVSLDGFYTHFSNKIIPDYDRDPNLIVYENLDGYSVTRGFAVALDQNFTALPFRYNINFTLMDVFTQENGERQALTYAPDFTGSWGAAYQLPNWNMEIGYTGNLVGPKRMPDNYIRNYGYDRWSPTHTTHNLKISKEFTNVNSPNGLGIEAYLSIENIFDYTQDSPLIEAASPFSPQFDTIYTWGPIVGRTFLVGARLNIR